MRNYAIRIVLALLTFIIGACATVMIAPHFHKGLPPLRKNSSPPATSSQSAANDDPVARIKLTVTELRKIKVDGLNTDVPKEARPLLTRLKHQLLDLTEATINDKKNQQASPQQLHNIVMTALKSLDSTLLSPENYKEDEYIYEIGRAHV